MLSYLNNDETRKSNPNENFAREVLELYNWKRSKLVVIIITTPKQMLKRLQEY